MKTFSAYTPLILWILIILGAICSHADFDKGANICFAGLCLTSLISLLYSLTGNSTGGGYRDGMEGNGDAFGG